MPKIKGIKRSRKQSGILFSMTTNYEHFLGWKKAHGDSVKLKDVCARAVFILMQTRYIGKRISTSVEAVLGVVSI